ncbi:TBC1 domain family member 5-like isoform X1 [Mytilus californianus]|uniref:TBC1 domain family member 5-like isoform X1 n=1 Tax=Mytilus californianus TaxID=6549 RepID=UPI0022455047|nr:TBC1 domain family member 5-like isoform X1 [Mytilus californianus]
MISRIRSASLKSKLENSTLSKPRPSKEDIISTIDGFSGNVENGEPAPEMTEDNNNLTRHSSKDSVNSDSWEIPDIKPIGASYTNAYSTEWEKLYTKPNYRRLLKHYAMNGYLRSSRFRSVSWKVFLEVLPDDVNLWVSKTREWRNKFDDLKNSLIVNPRKAVDHIDLCVNNPLSQADESPWNRFFQDNELRLTIKQDVIRTFPEVQFFQSEEIQERMIDLLFIICKTRSTISYKQGMHELLAPLVFVLHCDHQAFLHASEVESLGNEELPVFWEIIKEVMNPSYLEHDAYAMLSQIMETVEPWYVSKDPPHFRGKERMTTTPFARPQDLNPSNAIVSKLTRIQDYILKKFDIELHMHLDRLEIPPQIYGIRWIRLLFGREFPMQDLLVLWDALFADGIGFDLVDFIFVAMLLYIRDLLLASDYPQCLNCLMRYPPVGDVHYLIEKARYLRDPNSHPRPPNYTYQNVNIVKTASVRNKPIPASNSSIVTTNTTNKPSMTTSWSSFSRRMSGSRPKTLIVSSDKQKMYKSTSVPMNLQTDISPGTPQYPKQKRGSSASLSQMEDGYFKSGNSTPSTTRIETSGNAAAAMARMEPSVRQTSGLSPNSDDGAGSMSKFATLPSPKGKGKKVNKEKEYEFQIGILQNQMSEKESMCDYASQKLDIHIDRLQSELLQQNLQNEDEILIAIAGIKQVRDLLKGTLKFSQNLVDDDTVLKTSQISSQDSSSPETDSSVDQPINQKEIEEKRPEVKKGGKMFYMSSEENSEVADSPTNDFVANSRIPETNYELNDYTETHKYRAEPKMSKALQYEGKKGKKNNTNRGENIENITHPIVQSSKTEKDSLNPFDCSDSEEDENFSHPLVNTNEQNMNPFYSDSGDSA